MSKFNIRDWINNAVLGEIFQHKGHVCFSCSEKLNLTLDTPARVATAKCCHCKKVKNGASIKFYKQGK